MRPSISRQLVLWLAVPLMLLALCSALVHYLNNITPSVMDSDRRLREAANAIMAHLDVQAGAASIDERREGTPRLPSADSVIYVVRDTKGKLLIGDPQLPLTPMSDETSQLTAIARIGNRNARCLTTRFDTNRGVVFITVADVKPPAETAARYGLMSTLLWDFVQLDLTLVLVWIGIQLGLRPVKRLREEIAARSVQDLRPIDEAVVPREIAPVVVNINRLFALLRTSVQAQQQFISNTAHQLRTPITGMQAQLELLISEHDAQPVRHRLLTLQESIRQLAHSSNQLLALARADPAANIAARKQMVDLAATVSEVAARYFDRAIKSHIDLGINVDPITIKADPSLLDDLLSNLVDNALKYTPPGGSVTVSAGHEHGKAYLAIEDTGPGIPEAERQRVRQRFYRMPNSPGHGSGLGLAIVDEIAQLHDASVEIGWGADGAGTRIVVQFS